MAKSPTKSSAGASKAGVTAVDNIDDILGCVRYFLCFTSKRPLEDANAIEGILNECRSAQIGSGQVLTQPQKESSQMFKDELMPESKAGSTASDADLPIRSAKLVELLNAVVDDPEKWLSTPSVQFGGRRPGDLVGTDEEVKILDLLHAVDQGLF